MSDIKKEIASRVRELRDCSNIDIPSIAEMIGVSVAEYTAMEEGDVDFPASLLWEIANRLGADLTEILTGRPAHVNKFSVTRNGAGVIVKRRNQYDYENLAQNFLHKKCEPFIVTVPVTETEAEQNVHPGQEFIYVLEGKMEVKVLDNVISLTVGDSIYLDSTNPHSMKALDGTPARFIDVIL